MLIDGVGVKEVVLHASDDLAEIGQIAAENAELVHAPQFVQDAMFLPEKGKKTRAVARVGAEAFIHLGAGAPECADHARRHAAQARALRHDEEGFQNGFRRALENVFINNVEKLVGFLEPGIDRRGRMRREGKNGGADGLQQNGVDLGDDLGCLVIPLHELFAGTQGLRRDKTHPFGDGGLVIKEQAVFLTPGKQVQFDAQAL